jgi:serine/threonine protein kinase
MICLECNTANIDGSRFCLNCGSSLSADSPISQAPTSNQDLVGMAVAGRYRLEAKIGAGGMGAVYRATRLLIGDEVAIKILHSEQNDPRAAERFKREAQAAARLKHPNAVNIYDFGVTEDGLQYLVMELVEGESLRQIIKQQGPITPLKAAEILTQVCAALDEAHRNNIIHRDIKPDNIIVSALVTGLRVKVLDFGIAKLRDDTADNLTQTGNVLGTPHYMSPEQCIGEELDSRSDIYSLGIVLYEMLTARVPFNSPVSTAVVIQHVNQTPPSLRALNPSIPPAVETVALQALEKTREARPQSARELASAFEIAVRDGYVSAKPAVASFSASGYGAATPASSSDMPATTLLDRVPSDSAPAGKAHLLRRPKVLLVAAAITFLMLGGLGFLAFRGRANRAAANAKGLSNNSALSPDAAAINFSKNFAGLVGGKFKMVLRLRRDGTNLSGTYFYQPANDAPLHGNFNREPERWADKDNGRARIDVPIKGTVDSQQNFIIEEFDGKGSKTGIFNGRFVSDAEMEGTWSKPNGKSQTQFSLKDEGDKSSGGSYTIVSKTIRRKTGKMKVEVSYPQLEGLSDDDVQKRFNERVLALVTKDIGGVSGDEGEHGIGFSVDHRSGNLVSVIFGAYYEMVGAAHGQSYNFSYHYDLGHNKELELSDFFSPGVSHLSLLSKLCAKDIAKQKRKNGMEDIYEDGEATALEALKDDATFYPSATGLVFIFDPYQVGSYAEGYYVVSIPYSQLRNIIDPNGPLAPFVN